MRVLSFQGKQVWDKYLSKGITYHANWNLSRECANLDDIADDVAQLSGECPIWGYTQPYFNYTNIWDGSIIEKIRCEMSLDQDDAFIDMYLLELEVPLEEVFRGKHHNDNKFVITFGRIECEWIRAVYNVEDCKKGNSIEQWYYKVITNIYSNIPTDGKLDIITTKKIDMWELSLENDWSEEHHPPYSTTVRHKAKCLGCNKDTVIWYKDKPICSLSCLTKLRLSFGIAGIEYHVDGEHIFDKTKESEFRNSSIRELVKAHSKDIDVKSLAFIGWVCVDGKHYEWRK